MNEKTLAIYDLNVYPRKGEDKSMVNGAQAESTVVKNEQAANSSKSAKPEKTEEKPLTEAEKTQKAVKDAIKEFVEENLEEKIIHKTEEEIEKAEGGPSAKKANTATESPEASFKIKITTYFPQLPSNAAVYKEAQAFYFAAQGKSLSEISDTKFITKYYIKLRSRAEEEGENNLQFLSELKKELEKRSINPDAAYKVSKEAYIQRVEEEYKDQVKQEVTKEEEPTLRSQLRLAVLQEELQNHGKDVFSLATETKNELSKASSKIKPQGPGTMPRADEYVDLPHVGNPTLDAIADQLNNLGFRQRGDFSRIERQLERVERIVDEGRVPPNLAREIINGLEGWRTQARSKEERRYEAREKRGIYGERKLSKEEKRMILLGTDEDIEPLFNRMFSPVDARSKEQFREAFGAAGENEFSEFIRVLTEARDSTLDELDYLNPEDRIDLASLRREIDRKIKKYTAEKDAREIIHNANYVVLAGIGTEKLVDFIGQFRAEHADLVFAKKGITSAMHFYEQALLRIREENGGYIPDYEVVGEAKTGKGRAEDLTRKYLEDAVNSGMLYEKDETGTMRSVRLEKWEVDRAVSIARGMSIITGRAIEIAASSTLPPKNALISLYAQDIIKELYPFRHTVGKFKIGEEASMVFGFLLKGRKNGWNWTYDELKELYDKGHEEIINVANSFTQKGNERFLSMLNPYKVGSLFTRTTWRVTTPGVTDDNPIPTLLDSFSGDQLNYIGTGVIIEKNRGKLKASPKDEKEKAENAEAEMAIKKALKRVSEILPLKIFLQFEEQQKMQILRDMGVRSITDEEMEQSLNDLTILQEKAVMLQADNLDFSSITDITRRTNVEKLVGLIRGQFTEEEVNNFIKKLRDEDWKVPFVFGTEDLPYYKYHFGAIGGTGIVRIWRDNKSAAAATAGMSHLLEGLPVFKKMEDIVKIVAEIHKGIEGYDKGHARHVTRQVAEGIIKFYGKQYYHRLPLGIGTLSSLIDGRASYAQVAFGRGAIAWDETEVNEFTRLLRDAHLIDLEQQHELQKRAGGSRVEVAYSLARTLVPLLMLSLIYYLITKGVKEK